MKIAMIGTGYVGLVTGACFAEFGHVVTCVDNDAEKVKKLNEGLIPIYEPGLEQMVHKCVGEERLFFTTDIAQAVSEAGVVFIAVGTPTSRRGEGHADLTYVYGVAEEIAEHLDRCTYTVIVDKSTVPVGTAAQVKRIISKTVPAENFDVVSNPEFLREGAAIEDFMRPDRIVIGVDAERAEIVLKKVYDPINLTKTPFVVMDVASAELTKYAGNAFLAVKISFINEMAQLCESVGADVIKVALGIGMDNRIGAKFLHPGPGYGGSCFPKDTKALLATALENGIPMRLVESAIEANVAQKSLMIKKIRDAFGGSEDGKVIAVLGLAFKPETDDMRDAPAVTILPALMEKGAIVRVHDPHAMEEALELLPKSVVYCKNSYDACSGADAVVLMTEWNQYRALDLDHLRGEMNDDAIFIDLRNVYVPSEVRKHGFEYIGVGRM